MVNTTSAVLHRTTLLVSTYVTLVVATIVALVVMSAAGSSLATDDAWVHAVIVGVFAVLLPLRLRSAKRGSASALRAVGIIGVVLVVVNLVEAAIPGLFPTWMRLEMLVLAVVTGAIALSTLPARRTASTTR